MPYKMHISPDKVEQTRAFFKTRGGCLLWHSQDLSMLSRPEIMTPATHEDGSPATPPHWAYGNPEPLRPEDIGVRTETKIEPPLAWFPECSNCGGSGRRPVAEIAKTWQVSPGKAKERLRNDPHKRDWDVRDSDDTLLCFQCDGTGRTPRKIYVALKKSFYGSLGLKSTRKPEGLAAKLGELHGTEVSYDWENEGYGRGSLVFYAETIVPFTLEEAVALETR